MNEANVRIAQEVMRPFAERVQHGNERNKDALVVQQVDGEELVFRTWKGFRAWLVGQVGEDACEELLTAAYERMQGQDSERSADA